MSKKWTTVVEPKTKLFDIPLKELIQYRELIHILVKRNYQIQYKQTILGPFWMIFGLIFNTGIFSFVFGYVGNFSSDGTPYFLFCLTGSTIWAFFSDCFYGNSNVLMDNSYLFGKVYFPRLIMPLVTFQFNLVKLLIKCVVVALSWIAFFVMGSTEFSKGYILLVIPIVILTGILGSGLGMLIACSTTKYRDFQHLTSLFMSLLMYCSPVLYSINELPKWLQNIVFVNPMSSYIEIFRYAITGSGVIHWWAFLYSVVVTGIVLVLSIVVFNQTEKTYIDVI